MVDETLITLIIIVTIAGAGLGGFMAAMIPFWRKEKAREDRYSTIAEKDPTTLTPEEKYFKEQFEKNAGSLSFAQRYKYTAILGTTLGFVLALSSEAGVIAAASAAAGGNIGAVEIVSAFVKGLGLSGFFTFVTNQGTSTS